MFTATGLGHRLGDRLVKGLEDTAGCAGDTACNYLPTPASHCIHPIISTSFNQRMPCIHWKYTVCKGPGRFQMTLVALTTKFSQFPQRPLRYEICTLKLVQVRPMLYHTWSPTLKKQILWKIIFRNSLLYFCDLLESFSQFSLCLLDFSKHTVYHLGYLLYECSPARCARDLILCERYLLPDQSPGLGDIYLPRG